MITPSIPDECSPLEDKKVGVKGFRASLNNEYPKDINICVVNFYKIGNSKEAQVENSGAQNSINNQRTVGARKGI